MIHSENFQALEFVKNKYAKTIDYIYIDPPYNTDSTPILYKNGYRDSSWMSLIRDRVKVAQKLQTETGVFTVAIDDTELHQLFFILKQSFENSRLSQITVVHNPKGSPTKDFNRTHEYALFVTPENVKNCIARIMEENEKPRKMRRWGENSLRSERPLSFYPIYVKNGKIISIGEVPEDDFHPTGKNEIQQDGSIAIWPIDQNGVERRWNFGLDSIRENLNRITIIDDDGTLDLFLTHEMTIPKTVWKGGEYDAGSYGNSLLIDILGKKIFDFPKSINTMSRCVRLVTDEKKQAHILDFFAGSGTTGHAVLNLNREDNGNRKYILVEMGEYFNAVTKPRITKIVYSPDWKDGNPLSKDKGISHCFKYMRLESYEDALSNVALPDDDNLNRFTSLFGEEYLIKYMLDLDTAGSVLNLAAFNDPFDYKLKVTEKNENKEVNADLMETFNYLIGLTVNKMYARKIFSATPDPAGEYDGAVKLTGNDNGEYIFRQIEGTLPSGERALIIWRNITDNLLESNAALDAYFQRYRINPADREYDVIYVNGDNNIANLKNTEETWKVRMIEPEFKAKMFEEE